MPVLRTRIRTSLIPIAGIGTSRSSRPGPGPALTSASIDAGRTASLDSAEVAVVIAHHFGPVDDRVLDRADPRDLTASAVAGLEEHRWILEDAYARRRPRGDDVARFERD